MALSIDGHAITAAGDFGGSASGSISITTTQPKDLIVVVIAAEVFSSPHTTVSSVTASGLTFTKRSSLYQDAITGQYAETWNTLEVWSAPAASPLSAVSIAVTMDASVDCGMVEVFAVNYDGSSYPVFSSNASLPATATSSATSAPTVGSIATDAAALLLGFASSAVDANQTAGSGFTLIDTGNNGNGGVAMAIGGQYEALASAASGQTVTFGSTFPTWSIIGDAIEAPGGGGGTSRSASVNATLAALTSTATAQAVNRVSVNATLAPLTVTATATNSGGVDSAAVNATLAPLTSTATARTIGSASVNATLAPLTTAAAATVLPPQIGMPKGFLFRPGAGPTFELSRRAAFTNPPAVQPARSASVAGTLAPLTSSATATVVANAAVNATLQALTSSSAATAPDTASASPTLAPLTVTATAQAIDNASVNATLAPLTAAATAASGTGFAVNATLAPLTTSATAVVVSQASVNATLSPLTTSAVISDPDTASAGTTLAPLTCTATAQVVSSAQANATLAPLTVTAIAQTVGSASVDVVLAPLTVTARLSKTSGRRREPGVLMF